VTIRTSSITTPRTTLRAGHIGPPARSRPARRRWSGGDPRAQNRRRVTAILSTKLFEPGVPRDLVARPRLVERLRDALEARVTLVSAPAGYGKSTLLAEWRASPHGAGLRVAWLSVDEADNDPMRFWGHLGAALERASPGLGDQLIAAVAGVARVPLRPLIEDLVNLLAESDEPLVIVLDDLHAVSSEEVVESVGFLIGHVPPSVHVIVATRADPLLPIASWRARHDVLELRVPDLRFTPDELGDYFAGNGVVLDDASLGVLASRTEGWAAGVRLAALTLVDVEDRARFVESFGGDHRSVVDYLVAEVLARQRDTVLDFLLATCVLERMCGPLCDAMTGRLDGQAMLETLEASNLFIVPLDTTRTWFRYHHLFADLLRRELRLRRADTERQLHAAAARWLSAAGSATEAVPHAVASGDWDLVIHLGTEHGLDLVVRGETGALHELYGSAGEELRDRPEAALGFAWVCMLAADLEGARRWLDRAAATIAETPDVPAGAVLDAEILRAVLADRDGDAATTMRSVDRVLQLLDRHPEVTGIDRAARRARVLLYRARDHLWHDRRAAALDVVREVFAEIAPAVFGVRPEQRPARPVIEALGLRALLAVWDGRIREAVRDADEALDIEHERELDGTAHGSWAQLAIGTHHLERLALDEAEHHLARALEIARTHREVRCVALVVSAWSEWLRLSGLPAEAIEAVHLLDEELRHAVDPTILGLRPLVRAHALAWLAVGDVDRADSVWREVGAAGATSARIALARGDAAGALADAERLTAGPRTPCAQHERIQALGAAALALNALGDHVGSAARLADAVRAAAPIGWLAPLTDLGPSLRPLLSRLTPDPDPSVIQLRARALDVLAGRRPAALVQDGLVERLSERELAVLRRLPSALSNQEIAALLYVSLNTVKTQLQSIYRKLGVRSRHEAIERARQFGLL
jgi:LuxR family maltose regulon positive regulatory protein